MSTFTNQLFLVETTLHMFHKHIKLYYYALADPARPRPNWCCLQPAAISSQNDNDLLSNIKQCMYFSCNILGSDLNWPGSQ